MFKNPASVTRLPVATGNITLQANSKISHISITADGTNGGVLQVYTDGAGSDATTIIAELTALTTEKYKDALFDPPIWKRGATLYCKLTGTASVAYIAWE